jgi:hypothetical protein
LHSYSSRRYGTAVSLFHPEKLIVHAKQPGTNIAVQHSLLAQTPEQPDNGGYSLDYYVDDESADDENKGGRNGDLGYGHGSNGNGTAGRLVGTSGKLDEGIIRQDKRGERACGYDVDVRHQDEQVVDSRYDADDKHKDERNMDDEDDEAEYDMNAIAESA